MRCLRHCQRKPGAQVCHSSSEEGRKGDRSSHRPVWGYHTVKVRFSHSNIVVNRSNKCPNSGRLVVRWKRLRKYHIVNIPSIGQLRKHQALFSAEPPTSSRLLRKAHRIMATLTDKLLCRVYSSSSSNKTKDNMPETNPQETLDKFIAVRF